MKKSKQSAGASEAQAEPPADEVIVSEPRLPPYGFMNTSFLWDVHTRRVPAGFTIDGHPGTEAEWTALVAKLVAEIAAFLWPRFDRARQVWVGASGPKALELTMADLVLNDKLRPTLLAEAAVRDDKAAPVSLGAVHRALFELEDYGGPGSLLFPSLDSYLRKAPESLILAVKKSASGRLGGFGPAPLRFKEYLQRPRPYQMAFMLGRTDFDNEWAKSGVTPAMISGHSIQGLVGFCGAYMDKRRELEDLAGGVAAMQQMSVDFGDRRVFAGVHYPSDNVGSWYVALRLCSYLYGDGKAGQVAKTFMWEAISKRSAVYAAMKDAVALDARSPFAPLLTELQHQAGLVVPSHHP
jgi:hypothetical protein